MDAVFFVALSNDEESAPTNTPTKMKIRITPEIINPSMEANINLKNCFMMIVFSCENRLIICCSIRLKVLDGSKISSLH